MRVMQMNPLPPPPSPRGVEKNQNITKNLYCVSWDIAMVSIWHAGKTDVVCVFVQNGTNDHAKPNLRAQKKEIETVCVCVCKGYMLRWQNNQPVICTLG